MPALLASALFPFPAFLFICLPGGVCTSSNRLYTVRGPQGFLSVSTLLRDSVSAFRPACLPFCVRLLPSVSLCLRSCLPSCWSLCPPCPPSVTFVSLLVSLLVGHCVRLVAIVCVLSPFCFFLSPFLSPFLLAIVSVLSPFCFLLSLFLSPFLLMSQNVDLGMLRCCPTCLGSTPQCVSSFRPDLRASLLLRALYLPP